MVLLSTCANNQDSGRLLWLTKGAVYVAYSVLYPSIRNTLPNLPYDTIKFVYSFKMNWLISFRLVRSAL